VIIAKSDIDKDILDFGIILSEERHVVIKKILLCWLCVGAHSVWRCDHSWSLDEHRISMINL